MKFWIYGKHSCIAALKNQKRIIYEAKCINSELKDEVRQIRSDLRTVIVDKKAIDKCAKGGIHQGIALYCESLKIYKSLNDIDSRHEKIVILDRLQDMHNIGAIIRSMVALNFTALIVLKNNSPNIEQSGIKGASGGIEFVEIFQISNLTECIKMLQKKGFFCVALDSDGVPVKKIDGKIAVVIGSECDGVKSRALKACDSIYSLNTNSDFPILNASIAAGIFMYIISR